MLKRGFASCLCLLLLLVPQAAFAYKNPTTLQDEWGQYGLGDPFVFKFNGLYYLYVSTRDTDAGIKVWSSPDLVNWTYRGLCATDPVTKAAYAPEVVYWNGYFYMYTSPAGNGHYVLRSESPTGPFTVQTGNLGKTIDGSVFIDDDGSWYFYHANGGGILAAPMDSPISIGASVNTGASMGGWTEGPSVFKRNGKYYMTYTGNHVFSKGYRVDYAVSSNPASGFAGGAQNPILISTEGPTVGLGHSSVVVGPNLDARYMIYHNLEGPGIVGPLRHMNMDRVVFNGDNMMVLGPTSAEQPNPDMPDFYDRFDISKLDSAWSNAGGGSWKVQDGMLKQDTIGGGTAWYKELSNAASGNDYTAEFNTRQVDQGASANPKHGAVFSYTDENNYGVAVLSRTNNRLETQFRVNGVDQGWVTSELPAGYDYTKWHSIRVEKASATFNIYVDNMLKQTRDIPLGGGRIGYMTEDAHADFGFVAFSNAVNGSSDYDAAKPVPGNIEAVHYISGGEGIGYHDLTPDTQGAYRHIGVETGQASDSSSHIIGFEQGEWLNYRVNIAESGIYDIDLSYMDAADEGKIQLWLDDATNLGVFSLEPDTIGEGWSTAQLSRVSLPAGEHYLKVAAVSGTTSFNKLSFRKSADVPVLFDSFDNGKNKGWNEFEGFWSINAGEASDLSEHDAYKPVPGIINTVSYISGGEGVGYHDNTLDNIGGQYRGDSVDIRENPVGGGYTVGWNQTGEWLKYNIDVAEAGTYNAEFKVATTFEGARIRLWLDDTVDLTGIVNIPNTGGWNNWDTVVKSGIRLPAGKHTLKAETVTGEFDFAGIALTSFDLPHRVPGIIEMEHYKSGGEGVGYHDLTAENIGGQYRSDAVDIRSTPAGDQITGWNQTGEWLKYNINVTEAGPYDLDLWAATTLGNAKVRLWLDDNIDLTGLLSVPNTGDWNKWQAVSKKGIPLPEGEHELKVEIVQGEFDMTRLSLTRFDEAHSLPGLVPAVDYITGGEGVGYHDLTPSNIGMEYRADAVDIRRNMSGSYNVGWNQTGEWLKYNVDIAEAGEYNIDFLTATTLEGGQVRLWLDDSTDLTGAVNIPNSGSWETWATTTRQGVYLPAGRHTLKAETVKGEFDFKGIRVHQEPIIQPAARSGEYHAAVGSFGKTTIGDSNWSDYSVESDIKLVSDTGDGGILFRVNNPAHGKELGQNSADFLQGYVAYLNKDGVHLGKFNYNWTYLTGVPLNVEPGKWKHMKVVAQGARIQVYVDDMEHALIDYTDRSGSPFTHGNVGLRTFLNETSYDNFAVLPVPMKPEAIRDQMNGFASAGELKDPLWTMLSNGLDSAERAAAKAMPDWRQAVKHLNDVLKHLHQEAKQELVSEQAKTAMDLSIRALIAEWNKN